MGSSPHLWFCACKTACLPLELLVSICPRPHLCIFANKTACHTSPYRSQTSSVDLWMQNGALSTWIYKSIWVPAIICGFCVQNRDFRTRIASLCGSQTSPIILCMQNSVIIARISSLNGSQPSFVVLCNQNSDFRTRLTSLYVSQTSSVGLCTHNSGLSTRISSPYGFQPSHAVLCMQNSVISTWITCLYVSQPSSVVFACKTAHFGPALQFSMGPRPHLWFWEHITACLAQEWKGYMGSSPHLCFVYSKQRP